MKLTESIVIDGIIKEELFNKETKRLLIVCKEPNGKNHEGQPGSFPEIWGNGKPDYQFARNVGELCYGVLNNFKAFDDVRENTELCLQTLKRIAFINVKKTPGIDISNNSIILKHVKQSRELIIKQILEINPTHIILGLSMPEISQALFDQVEFKPTGYGCLAAEWKGIKIIHFLHPSARGGRAALYALLKVNFEVLKWID